MLFFSPMLSKTKKQTVGFTPLFLGLAVLMQGCDNEFMKTAANVLVPGEPVKNINMEWTADVLYIDPLSGAIAGTFSGLLNNAGNRIWFAGKETVSNSVLVYKRDWDLTGGLESSDKGEFITAGSLVSYLVNSPKTENGDKIEVKFSGSVSIDQLDPVYGKGQTYSFILKPAAFRGADKELLSGQLYTTHDFTLQLPTKTFYSKYLMEKEEYGSVSVSWSQGNGTWEGMMDIAGSYAAAYAAAAALAWDSANWTWDGSAYPGVTVGNGGVSLAAEAWNTQPGKTKSYAPYGKYAIMLLPYYYTDEKDAGLTGPVSPVVSLPVEFTSDVGDAVKAIKASEEAGSFSFAWDAAGSEAVHGTISALITGKTTMGPEEPTWNPSFPAAAPKSESAHTLTITLGNGNDGSTGEVITVKAVMKP
jgi:flagellar hook assembly protein FlgD